MEYEEKKKKKAARTTKVKDIIISASEWLMPIEGPIFTESCT
jgi:hypothetical protein